MRSPTSRLTLGQALVLGVLHGPAELLPVSSSAHTEALPSLLGWDYAESDPSVRKTFAVALHAGTVVALKVTRRSEARDTWSALGRRAPLVIGLACAPAAIAGYTFEEQIERRLSTASSIAAALLGGALLMVAADSSPQTRRVRDARPQDGAWLGVAQACALVPGISRAGATRSAARLLRFRRADAAVLSNEVGIPVLAGATLLKAGRLRGGEIDPATALTFAVAAGASFASTLATGALLRRGEQGQRLLPYAAYRAALAALILKRRRRSKARPPARSRR